MTKREILKLLRKAPADALVELRYETETPEGPGPVYYYKDLRPEHFRLRLTEDEPLDI